MDDPSQGIYSAQELEVAEILCTMARSNGDQYPTSSLSTTNLSSPTGMQSHLARTTDIRSSPSIVSTTCSDSTTSYAFWTEPREGEKPTHFRARNGAMYRADPLDGAWCYHRATSTACVSPLGAWMYCVIPLPSEEIPGDDLFAKGCYFFARHLVDQEDFGSVEAQSRAVEGMNGFLEEEERVRIEHEKKVWPMLQLPVDQIYGRVIEGPPRWPGDPRVENVDVRASAKSHWRRVLGWAGAKEATK
ncbi:MAG: hypothetical protein Q9227_001126 [Pyrenula ochraceoflavens]